MAKRKYRKKLLPVRVEEGPNMERCGQLGGVIKEVIDRDARGRVLTLRSHAKMECMLDAYLIKHLIEKAAHEAGMRFRKAWLRSVECIQVEDRFSSGRSITFEEWLDSVSADDRYIKEAFAVLTDAQKKVVQHVCIDDKRAGGTDALETLRRGLANMAREWGMI